MVISIPSTFTRCIFFVIALQAVGDSIHAPAPPPNFSARDETPPPSEAARNVFRAIQTLQLGKSDYLNATELAQTINAKPVSTCTAENCTWVVQISGVIGKDENSAVMFLGSFSVSDNKAWKKAFALQIGEGVAVPFVRVSEETGPQSLAADPPRIEKQSSTATPFYRAFIWISPTVDRPTREKYEDLNFGCLDQSSKCMDAKSLLQTLQWP